MTDIIAHQDIDLRHIYADQSTVRDYVALLKPRVMTLVVFTGIAGIAVAPGGLHPLLAFIAVLSIALGAGAAGAINMWYDRDIDAVMTRTQKRPIPAGRIHPDDALAFGVVLTVLSVLMMGVAVNWIAGGLLAFASFFYVFVYTVWLKRRTPQNIVIGGAAGAFPPMIGWAAVTGDITLQSFVLFMIIFVWTPPHFWALALYKNADYTRANVPMMPVVRGMRSTKWQMLAYTLALVPLSLAPYAMGMVTLPYALAAGVLGVAFIVCALRVLRDETFKSARDMFAYSIFYLFAVFATLMFTVA